MTDATKWGLNDVRNTTSETWRMDASDAAYRAPRDEFFADNGSWQKEEYGRNMAGAT